MRERVGHEMLSVDSTLRVGENQAPGGRALYSAAWTDRVSDRHRQCVSPDEIVGRPQESASRCDLCARDVLPSPTTPQGEVAMAHRAIKSGSEEV